MELLNRQLLETESESNFLGEEGGSLERNTTDNDLHRCTIMYFHNFPEIEYDPTGSGLL